MRHRGPAKIDCVRQWATKRRLPFAFAEDAEELCTHKTKHDPFVIESDLGRNSEALAASSGSGNGGGGSSSSKRRLRRQPPFASVHDRFIGPTPFSEFGGADGSARPPLTHTPPWR